MSVYKVVEITGTSTESWADAGLTAVKKARETLRNLQVGEVRGQELDLDDNGRPTFRTTLRFACNDDDDDDEDVR
jgi:flavin-binding protein dodecin